MILSKEFRFEASHQIYNHPGKCAQLHGHSWKLTVAVEGLVRPDTGMVMDYAVLKECVQPLIDRLDHTHLGLGLVKWSDSEPEPGLIWIGPSHELSLPKLPTSENLLVWIAGQLPLEFPWIQLELDETCTSSAVLTREDYERTYARTETEKA